MTSISSFSGSDLLGPMRGSMNSIAAAGAPTNDTGASRVLSNGAGYLQGAHETIAKIDQSIERRTKALTELQQSDPAAAQADLEQLDLLNRLRTRIEQSIQRVGEILGGDTPDGQANKTKLQQQAEDLDQLEARRRLLAGSLTFDSPVAATQVASTYAAGRA
ncbi:MAG: hypothetical protein JWN72_2120 [Thermoleophilia bacterium]|nr:hypothetical protein [Thermoleophilia bacterium]